MSLIGMKKGGGIDGIEFMTTIIRYAILLTLFPILFYYMNYPNLQFIVFIVLLILVVFGTTFVIRDLAVTTGIWESITKIELFSILTNNSGLLKIFLGVVAISVIFNIISITLMIVVLNYGRKQLATDENTKKKLTYDNTLILKHYKTLCTTTIIMTIALIFIIFITYASVEVRILLKNIVAIIISLGILGLSSYQMVFASKFFDIFKKKGLLYEVSDSLE